MSLDEETECKGLLVTVARNTLILGLLVGCTQSDRNPHDEACAGGSRLDVLSFHHPEQAQSNEAFLDVGHEFDRPWGRFLFEEMRDDYRMMPSLRVLVDPATEFRDGPALPIEAELLTAVETSPFCPDSGPRYGSMSIRRCGNSIALRPEGSPDPLIGIIDPETGFFSANDPVLFEFMFGYLYEDRTGYVAYAHRADPDCRVTGMLLRPADRACALSGRYEGRFDVDGPLFEERCPSFHNAAGVIVVESGQMTIEVLDTVVTGAVDAECRAELASADGTDRWSLHCDERGRCSGTREQTGLGCSWLVSALHPHPPEP